VLAAITEVHGEVSHEPFEAAGRTDRWIVREILRRAGKSDAVINSEMEWLLQIAVREYERRCPADLSEYVLPEIPELLRSLCRDDRVRLGLVTGNLESIAMRKLHAAGLSRFLMPWVGGFGSDAEDRNRLVQIAQERAGADFLGWPSAQTVVVGDTPHDIACAHAVGATAIGVTTGAATGDELVAADHVALSPGDLAEAIGRLTDGLAAD
jgi:phosphoglycolate phosphatase